MLRGKLASVRSRVISETLFERTYVDQLERKPGLRNEARFQTARRADHQDFSPVPLDQRARHGQRGNDVPARAAAGDEWKFTSSSESIARSV